MGTITPFVLPGEGFVRVEVDWRDFPGARKCWIYRRDVLTNVLTMLREGNAAPLSGGVAVAFDHEAPLDRLLRYRSVIAINANGDMEDGVTEWQNAADSGTVGTVAQSFDYYVRNEGRASLMLTPSGAAVSKAVSEFIPVTVGQTYTITGQLMVSDYWSGGIGVQIQWYNGVTPNGTVGATNDLTPFPGVFAPYGFSAVAPASTTHARLVAAIAGTPPTTIRLFGDEIYLTTTGTSTETTTPVTVPSAGGGWWTDPLQPWTKVRLQVELDALTGCLVPPGIAYLGVTEENLPADSTALEINDAAYPVGTWSRRKAVRQSIRIGTRTLADVDRVKLLHASGAPLFFHLNDAYGEPDSYQLYGDLAIGRLNGDQKVPWRLLAAPFTRTLPPVGPPEGTLGARYVDYTKYATFGAAMAANGGVHDDYNRFVGAGGWGSPTIGAGPWTVTGTAADYQVNGATGLMSLASLSTPRRAQLLAVSVADFNALATNTISAALTGGGALGEFGLRLRYIDANNFVDIRLFRSPTNVTVAVRQMLAGVETVTSFPAVPGATGSSSVTMRVIGVGGVLVGTAWVTGAVEPSAQVSLTGLTHLAAGGVELNGSLNASVTNVLPLATGFDNLQVTNLALNGGATWLDGLQGELVA